MRSVLEMTKTVRSKSTWILYTGYPYQDILCSPIPAERLSLSGYTLQSLSQLGPCLSLSGLELRLVVGRWKSYESIPIRCSPCHFHSKLPDTCYPYHRYTLKYQLALCLGNEVRFGDEL